MGATASIVSAAVTLKAAQQQKAAYEIQAQQYDEMAKTERIAMQGEELQRERNLFAQLASLKASGASRNINVGSGTMKNLATNERQFALRDISNIRMLGYNKINTYGLSAQSNRLSGSAAMTAGFAGAVGTIGQGVMKSTPTKGSGAEAGTMTSYGQQIKREFGIG